MRNFKEMSYSTKIQWRLRGCWFSLILMVSYCIFIVELGGGDSRIMSQLAQNTSRILFFGGIIYIITRIHRNRELLKNRHLMEMEQREKDDERNRYLHDKSGGVVMDLMMLVLLLLTWTASLFSMPAFYTVFVALLAAVILKLSSYLWYSRIS